MRVSSTVLGREYLAEYLAELTLPFRTCIYIHTDVRGRASCFSLSLTRFDIGFGFWVRNTSISTDSLGKRGAPAASC